MAGIKPARKLKERYPGLWPEWAPQSIGDLVNCEYSELKKMCKANNADDELFNRIADERRDAIAAIHASSNPVLGSPRQVADMLESGQIRPLARGYLTYALGSKRDRLMTVGSDGASHYLVETTRKAPTSKGLLDKLPVPDGGGWLIIYGGGPEALTDQDAEALSALTATGNVIDILFWHLVSGQSPALYSARAGVGRRGRERLEFPNQDHLAAFKPKD